MIFNPDSCLNERDVESKLIVQFLLPKLGYSSENWHQQVIISPGMRLDFLAFLGKISGFQNQIKKSNCLVIEAKHPNENINNHIKQLKNYLIKIKGNLGVLTNGREFRIYKIKNDNMVLLYQCFGKDIDRNFGIINELIGRDRLRFKKSNQNKKITKTKQLLLQINLEKQIKNNNKMKIIAIYHNKGGVGKTTVSVNLAAALSNKGKRVLLIDLDSQANSTFATGLIKFQFEENDNLKDSNVSHLIESGEFNQISEIKRKSNIFNSPEIDVIPSHITLIEKQNDFTTKINTRRRLISKLNQEEDNYDIVIIDAPPSRDVYAEIALISADFLIIPSDLKPFANQGLANVKDFIDSVNEFREAVNKDNLNVLGVLPSKILVNSKFMEYTFPKQKESVIQNYGFQVMESIIFERIALSNSLNKTIFTGVTDLPDPKSIFEFDRDSESVKEFRNFAVEVLEKIGL